MQQYPFLISEGLLRSDSYKCSMRGCNWDTSIKDIDWGYYSTTNGNCSLCMKICDIDTACEGVECGGSHCSWWKNGKCDEAHEHTLASNGVDKMCIKRQNFSGDYILKTF